MKIEDVWFEQNKESYGMYKGHFGKTFCDFHLKIENDSNHYLLACEKIGNVWEYFDLYEVDENDNLMQSFFPYGTDIREIIDYCFEKLRVPILFEEFKVK
jgi:hypothetical protein